MCVFFLSSLIFSHLLKREVRVGREGIVLALVFLWERKKQPKFKAGSTQPYLYLISFVIIIAYLIIQ